jgi:MFS transporter, DHA1 family, inner membrane transport protein
MGFVAPAWVGVALALGGLAIAATSLRLERSRSLVAA